MDTVLIRNLFRNGIMPTPQRLAVYAAMEGRDDHPGADRLFLELKKQWPSLSKTTVYSTLQLLASKRLIGRVCADRREMRYDGKQGFHAHFQCTDCGRLFDIGFAKTHRKYFASIPGGFEVKHEDLIYHGRCPTCGKRKQQ